MTIRLYFFIFLYLFPAWLYAQQEKTSVRTDTIRVEKNTLILTADSLYFVEEDTVLILQDTLRTRLDSLLRKEAQPGEKHFYDSLSQRFNDSSLLKKLVEMITKPASDQKPTADRQGRRNFPSVEGKIVGNIRFRRLDVFGPSVIDTAEEAGNRLTRKGNQLHMKTRKQVLRRRLQLRPGDVLDANSLMDNESLIRSLSYIRDARLLVEEVRGDTVDLLLVTQDIFPYDLSASPLGFEGLRANINQLNMLGSGHQLYNRLTLDSDAERLLGYEGRYRIPNLMGSQVEGEAYYRNITFLQQYGISAQRNFLIPGIRLAGGITLDHSRSTRSQPWIDSFEKYRELAEQQEIPRHTYRRFTQDYWLGYSFPVSLVQNDDERSRLVFASRYLQQNFSDRPEVASDLNRAFHHRKQLLFTLGLSRRYFRREKLVYGFGRTEDIPIGRLTEITLGPEWGEFHKRFYTGFRVSSGDYVKPFGYMTARLGIGGYWHNKQFEEGLLQLGLRSFTYPIQWKRTLFRLFLETDYSRRLSPMPREDFRENLLSLNNREGIRGLRHYRLYGGHRLSFSLETVAYLPFHFYNFRLATFFFADAGMIARHDQSLMRSKIYQGYGLGFRVRNERLALETFQLRFAVYPQRPVGAPPFGVTVAGLPFFTRLMDFIVRKPDSIWPR
ncbi:MAG: hypothetical protein ACLFUB_18875 [Cyclobacteriaceae bacterium]